MPDYAKELATAAEWIWQHRDEPQYWEWQDLTAHNDASDTLNMPDTIAWNIFTILQERELMLPFEFKKDEKIIHVFKINLNDEKAWTKTRKQPTVCYKYIQQPLAKFGINLVVFVIWILSLAISSSLTYGIKRFIDIQWPAPK